MGIPEDQNKFTNRLANETSPYLLQHAHNPVDWYPWGPEALQKAKAEDKPILVSIGYSACHWCHVMERESFEDESTATLMNALFVNIKIDREERPDLDHIYMEAVQAIAGNGGWPLNVFLTPDTKPFYGGTYFPPIQAYNRSSWKEVLHGVSALFKDKRLEVEAQANQLLDHVQSSSILQPEHVITGKGKAALLNEEGMLKAFHNIMQQADKHWGGFGKAPKFPQTFVINLLLRFHHYTGKEEALEQACLSLDKMLQGGIYDQIGGGFSRYATDTEWLAPHFEKMLYDNALMVATLADAFRITGKAEYRTATAETWKFISSELMDVNGTFYAALDADSEGEEGKFYTWTFQEINDLLDDNAAIFCRYYNVTEGGNWEAKNILRVLQPMNAFTMDEAIPLHDLVAILDRSKKILFDHRSTRVRPALDDKILTGWNALMIIALCKASAAFGNNEYKDAATRCFGYLWGKCWSDDKFTLHHTIKDGVSKFPAFLDDHAYMALACIHLYEVTSDDKYLDHARTLVEYVIENFSSDSGYFFFTGKLQSDIIVRKPELFDGPIPSGNSVLSWVLHYLGIVFENHRWTESSLNMLHGIIPVIEKYPSSFGFWGCVLFDISKGINEVAIVGKGFEGARDKILSAFIPNMVIQATAVKALSQYPLLLNKPESDVPVVYICRDYVCNKPLSDIDLAVAELLTN